MHTLHDITILTLLVCFSQAIPAPQQAPQTPAICDASWRAKPAPDIFQLLENAAPDPPNDADLQCRRTAADGLEWAASAAPHTVCPKYLEQNLPKLSACDYATRELISKLGGENRLVSFGDGDAGTCPGQKFCLPIPQEYEDCRVTLEFDPVIESRDRKDTAVTLEIRGKELYLEMHCAVFL